MLRHTTQATIGAMLLCAATAFAPAAHAERVGFDISIGGPGYALSVGNVRYLGVPPYRIHAPRPHWQPAYLPAPVFIAAAPVYQVSVIHPARVVYRVTEVHRREFAREPVRYRY